MNAKEMYFYSRKYPEYQIEKIIVNSEDYLVSKDSKTLYAIHTNYDISMLTIRETDCYIPLYQPYEDEEIYVHENTFGNELIFSYNQELINEWRNKDIKTLTHKLEERLKVLKGGSNE